MSIYSFCSALFSFRSPWIVILAVAGMLSSMTVTASAAPARFVYEVKLPASQGLPRTGEQLCVFSIFQGGSTDERDSGLLVYSESVRLQISNGIVRHTIGTGNVVFGNPLDSGKLSGRQDVFLQFSVGDERKVLLPRERLNSVPFAMSAGDSDALGGRAAGDYMLWQDYNSAHSKTTMSVPGTGVGSTIGGGSFNSASGDYSTVGGGYANSSSGRVSTIAGGEGNQATGNYGVIGGGYYSTAGYLSSVGGGIKNQAHNYSAIAGGYFNTASGLSSFVGGGAQNLATGERATVAGGWKNETTATYSSVLGGYQNRAWGQGATVSGGQGNTAYSSFGTIAGGQYNTAPGPSATVAGGRVNHAIGNSSTTSGGTFNTAEGWASVISGGQSNQANGSYSTVAGGYNNDALGAYSTVAGGTANVATGNYSFAAGRRAKALHQGSFVWADSVSADFASSTNDRFEVRVRNGAMFASSDNNAVEGYTANGGSAGVLGICNAEGGWGVYGACNSGTNAKGVHGVSTTGYAGFFSGKVQITDDLIVEGTINPPSDRDVKTNFSDLDTREILRRLLAIKIEKWTYRKDKNNAQHIGPMAQDFAAAFKVGADNKHISTIDADGVALAAIQGLHEELLERDRQLADQSVLLKAQSEQLQEQTKINEAQQDVLHELTSRLERLEKAKP